jgi:hypothetical protein
LKGELQVLKLPTKLASGAEGAGFPLFKASQVP